MFDIGWTELVVIAVVAILVVGPKDLPRMLRGFGRTMGQLRRQANEFKRQFDDALREAEREADLEDARKQVQSIARIDPLSDIKQDVEKELGPATQARSGAARPQEGGSAEANSPAPTGNRVSDGETVAGAQSKPVKPGKTGSEPAGTQQTELSAARRDSDAA